MWPFKKQKDEELSQSQYVEYAFVQTPNFRGFKRFRLTTYGNKLAEEAICEMLLDNAKFDMSSRTIVLRVMLTKDPYIVVFADFSQIGTLFRSSAEGYFDKIINGAFQAVHVRFTEEEVLDRSGKAETRHIPWLYINF